MSNQLSRVRQELSNNIGISLNDLEISRNTGKPQFLNMAHDLLENHIDKIRKHHIREIFKAKGLSIDDNELNKILAEQNSKIRQKLIKSRLWANEEDNADSVEAWTKDSIVPRQKTKQEEEADKRMQDFDREYNRATGGDVAQEELNRRNPAPGTVVLPDGTMLRGQRSNVTGGLPGNRLPFIPDKKGRKPGDPLYGIPEYTSPIDEERKRQHAEYMDRVMRALYPWRYPKTESSQQPQQQPSGPRAGVTAADLDRQAAKEGHDSYDELSAAKSKALLEKIIVKAKKVSESKPRRASPLDNTEKGRLNSLINLIALTPGGWKNLDSHKKNDDDYSRKEMFVTLKYLDNVNKGKEKRSYEEGKLDPYLTGVLDDSTTSQEELGKKLLEVVTAKAIAASNTNPKTADPLTRYENSRYNSLLSLVAMKGGWRNLDDDREPGDYSRKDMFVALKYLKNVNEGVEQRSFDEFKLNPYRPVKEVVAELKRKREAKQRERLRQRRGITVGAGYSQPGSFATGGLVYAQNGALINFQPKGTDTVPAMLTPGEFVINRDSTQKYKPVLEAINSGNYARGGIVNYLNKGGYIPEYKFVGGFMGSAGSATPSFDFTKYLNSLVGAVSSSITEAFDKALSGLKQPNNATGGVSNNGADLASIDNFVNRLNNIANILSNIYIPPQITITGKHDVVVTINGDTVLNQLRPDIAGIVISAIRGAFADLKAKNPQNNTMDFDIDVDPRIFT
jgi:hypothetical protein